jgi:hypothetical protein
MSETISKFGIWLADSPLGGMFKAASGAILVWCLDNITSFNLNPVVQVAIVASLPIAINYLNAMDPRYGNVAK